MKKTWCQTHPQLGFVSDSNKSGVTKKNKKIKPIRILLAGFTLIIIILLCQSQKNDEKLEQG